MAHRILLVEDDTDISQLLERALGRGGYDVVHVDTGHAALERVRDDVHLVLLDVNLPDLDGLEVCRRLRGAGVAVPVMIVSARENELDRVVGLDAGADDYLTKPFSLAELEARVRALLRRTNGVAAPAAPVAVTARVQVDTATRRVTVDGTAVDLSLKEFDVLALLAEEPGRVVSRERLMDEVWDENWFGSTKTLDVTVGRLRQKLRDAGAPDVVATVRGVGFRLDDDEAAGDV